MENLPWRRKAQPPSPLKPDEYQHHEKSDSKWDGYQRTSADKQSTAAPFHSQHEVEGGQESLSQHLDDLSLQIRPHASFTPNRACPRWVTEGSCTSISCPLAHHLFPRVVYRAHRRGNKAQDCQYVSSAGDCVYAEDMCGYSHETITPEVRQKQKQMVDRIKDQEQDWLAELALKCRRCSFNVDGRKWDATEDMIDHCQKKHPPAAEALSRNALSPKTANSFMTTQPGSHSPTMAQHPAIFAGVNKDGVSGIRPIVSLDDNWGFLPGSEDGNQRLPSSESK